MTTNTTNIPNIFELTIEEVVYTVEIFLVNTSVFNVEGTLKSITNTVFIVYKDGEDVSSSLCPTTYNIVRLHVINKAASVW